MVRQCDLLVECLFVLPSDQKALCSTPPLTIDETKRVILKLTDMPNPNQHSKIQYFLIFF